MSIMGDLELNKYLLKWERELRDADRAETWIYIKAAIGAAVLIGGLVGLGVLMMAA